MTPKNIIVHHTASPRDTTHIAAIDRYHKDKDWGGGARIPQSSLGWFVAYHYFIEADGKVTQCAKDNELRWHAAARNIDSIGICLAGWFDDGHDSVPTPAQIVALTALLKKLSALYGIPADRIYPHRTFAKKSCYGYHLKDDWAANLVRSKTASYQIIAPRYLAQYKPGDLLHLASGAIVLKVGVKVIPGTTKVVYL